MSGLVDAEEGEVAVLSHFSVFGPVDQKRCVLRGFEFGRVGIADIEGDCFAAEPITDIIGVTVVEGDADGVVENHF